ncbi:putative glutamate carboxypeptidase [Lachnellula subtilissima]|uniref:Putative glutamate carboxypeptidase n=1 Tax=Lachnellula subtilissima TaxID=602034 RepID=A0A8H8RWQ6_9HELO|nr:putative glutamate carboxypeptidase [Lachnellula subtilissima]
MSDMGKADAPNANKRGIEYGPFPLRPSYRLQTRNLVYLVCISTLLAFFVWASHQTLEFMCFPNLLDWKVLTSDYQPLDQFSFAKLEEILQTEPSASKIAEWSRYYTSSAHYAGQGRDQGIWTQNKWREFGIPETWVNHQTATIGHPIKQRLALLDLDGKTNSTKLLYEAKLTEDVPQDDPSSIRTPAYHEASPSDNITARFIYANFGYSEDYDDLEEAGIDLNEKIAIVKYGNGYRGEKVETAARRGLVGVVMYTDLQQDGNITENGGYKPYPAGPARPGTYIARGSIKRHNLNITGSNPAIPGRTIPSIPVSNEDIILILRALDGHGPKAAEMNKNWHGGALGRGVEYHTGPSPLGLVLNFNNQMNYTRVKAYNVLGRIRGSLSDVVVLGNHRDAWTAGTSDPNSGSAALNEIVRSFGTALKAGWKPRRTIIFASWDAHEIGLVGSRGWIAENLPWISEYAIAYLNVVVAASGKEFRAKATPLLYQVLQKATKSVQSPHGAEGQTIFDKWGGEIIGAGGGDAIPFLQTACVSTVDMGFSPGPNDAPFPYHSNFDTQAWMTTLGDPGWNYHLATTKIWSLMAGYLVDSPVLKIRSTDYANKMTEYVEIAKEILSSPADFDLYPLEKAIKDFHSACSTFDSYASSLEASEKCKNKSQKISRVNAQYKKIERQFCYDGSPDEPVESEHVIFGASAWFQKEEVIPRLIHSLKSGNWSDAHKWSSIIQSKIENATALLQL